MRTGDPLKAVLYTKLLKQFILNNDLYGAISMTLVIQWYSNQIKSNQVY